MSAAFAGCVGARKVLERLLDGGFLLFIVGTAERVAAKAGTSGGGLHPHRTADLERARRRAGGPDRVLGSDRRHARDARGWRCPCVARTVLRRMGGGASAERRSDARADPLGGSFPHLRGLQFLGHRYAVGPGARDESGKLVPLELKAGDRVLFGKWSGTEVKIDGEDLLIMKESDVMGVIEGASATKKKAA